MSGGEPTTGELHRLLERHIVALGLLTSQVADLAATVKVLTEVQKQARQDIADLESWQTWAMRIIIGAVVVAGLGIVLKTTAI